ncbi:MAG: non-heme iron oxygenase ferredoxin subunit [Gammaproteobacteria bacterium]|nr:non-heme iron oxygenase ferredoxin subunit [Gammaproteobacteria bacterium]
MRWIDAGAEQSLAEGQAISVPAEGLFIALVRCEGEIRALEDVCTHDGSQLTGGAIEGCEIICPRHGARFCARTGAALTPPAYEPVRTFETRIENGRIWIRIDD